MVHSMLAKLIKILFFQYRIKELHENTSPDTVIALVGNKIDMEDNKQVPTHVNKTLNALQFKKIDYL